MTAAAGPTKPGHRPSRWRMTSVYLYVSNKWAGGHRSHAQRGWPPGGVHAPAAQTNAGLRTAKTAPRLRHSSPTDCAARFRDRFRDVGGRLNTQQSSVVLAYYFGVILLVYRLPQPPPVYDHGNWQHITVGTGVEPQTSYEHTSAWHLIGLLLSTIHQFCDRRTVVRDSDLLDTAPQVADQCPGQGARK